MLFVWLLKQINGDNVQLKNNHRKNFCIFVNYKNKIKHVHNQN
jgi:2-keto-4-pentenoate hydratase/2-oxohepta-3-ene-1,7-dioic acid hydratase in catechol pathway